MLNIRNLVGVVFVLIVSMLAWSCGDYDESADEYQIETVEEGVVANNSTINNVQITHYTLPIEANLGPFNKCDHPQFPSCMSNRFLCTSEGVPMQGSGYTRDGRILKITNPQNVAWNANHTALVNCNAAQFAYVASVTGARNVPLVAGYSVAVDRTVITLGWSVWIDAERRWFRADDTGGLIVGNHIDLFEGNTGARESAPNSRVFVTSTPHSQNDAGPCGFAGWPACNQPPVVGNYHYWRSGITQRTRNVTIDYRDPEGAAPQQKEIQFTYLDFFGTWQFGSGNFSLQSGAAGNGTYYWTQVINGTQFKFYTNWRDAGGLSVRFPAAGYIENAQ